MTTQLMRRPGVLQVPLEVKEVRDGDVPGFRGRAAAFSLDLGGDIILPGAFKRTLRDWKSSKGKVIPLLDSHQRHTIRAVIGKLEDGEEAADGLDIDASFIDGPDGVEAHRRVKGGYVQTLSIGFEPVEVRQPDPEQRKAGVWRLLKEIKLNEVSLVMFPMNPDARIDLASVKSLLRRTDLTAAEREELQDIKQDIEALLKGAPSDPAERPAPEDPPAGLAIGDPRRLNLEALARSLHLRSLGLPL